MKRFFPLVLILAVLTLLSGCAGSNDTAAGLVDQTISADQTRAKTACYTAYRTSRPDMSEWSPEQIAQYELIQKLGDSNKLLAKVSLDPCHDAGGTNLYDKQIVQVKEGTKRQKNWMDFGLGVATKALYGFVAYEVADSYKAWVKSNDGDTIVNIENEEFADDVVLGEETPDAFVDPTIPEITP